MRLFTLAALLALVSSAHADNTVYGWLVNCQGANQTLQITQNDDDALLSAQGTLTLSNLNLGAPSTYAKSTKAIQFSNGDVSLTVVRSETNGVGTGTGYLTTSGTTRTLDCEIGYVPYEDGPNCLSDESLKDKACREWNKESR